MNSCKFGNCKFFSDIFVEAQSARKRDFFRLTTLLQKSNKDLI